MQEKQSDSRGLVRMVFVISGDYDEIRENTVLWAKSIEVAVAANPKLNLVESKARLVRNTGFSNIGQFEHEVIKALNREAADADQA